MRLNARERTDIAIAIRTYAKLENGLCVYNEGWDDERIQREFGGRADVEAVRAVRRATFGNLRTQALGHTIPKDRKVEERLVLLEKRVAALEASNGYISRPVQLL